jgi:hypothetical protein
VAPQEEQVRHRVGSDHLAGNQDGNPGRVDGHDVAAQGFLAFGGGGSTDVNALVADAEKLVAGVGEAGCGLEAQLESAYRFLIQPDPWVKVTLDQFNQADLGGPGDIDIELLTQRKAFLRPDSLVVVVMLTDEEDSSPDPLSVGGQGWAFADILRSVWYREDALRGVVLP